MLFNHKAQGIMGVVVSERLNKATHLCRSPGGEVNVMGPCV